VFGAALTFAIFGDAGRREPSSRQLLNSIIKSGIHNIVSLGDHLYEPEKDYDEVWRSWKHAGLGFDIVTIGNHYKDYESEMQYFAMPSEYYTRTFGASLRFIVLNSDNEKKQPTSK